MIYLHKAKKGSDITETEKVGERLKGLRGPRSKEEIAYRMGISVTSVCLYESGKRMPKDDVKIKLADFYGLTVQELFFPEQGKDKKKSTCS